MAYGDFPAIVGDNVGIVRRSRSFGDILMAKFGTVTKVNGHGHIFVACDDGNEYRFDKRGYSYKDEWGPSLIDAAKLREELAEKDRRKKKASLAREIEQKLKEGWSYSGHYHVSEARITDIKNLLSKLEELVDY